MTESLSSDQLFIKRLTDIIQGNLENENFSVRELARESGYSRYGLNRRLSRITNKTVVQFISEVRLQKALEMLRDENNTVSEIAFKTGFSSPAYFSKCFHEFFGYPPGEVKKRECQIILTLKILTKDPSENKLKKPGVEKFFQFLSRVPDPCLISCNNRFFYFLAYS